MNIPSLLYRTARIMDDFDAVKKGIVGKTVTGRAAGKVTGKGLGKQVKWMGIDPQGIDD